MAMLTANGLSKKYENTYVLTDVSFDVHQGTFLTLLGPSGCGKTTTLRIIAGFIKPDAGELYLEGNCLSSSTLSVHPEKRGMGMVFQSYALWPHMSVFENLAFGLKLRKVSREKIQKKVRETLGLVRLNGFENRYPSQLSGGQQQRIALARAIVIEPKILLLDEPLSNLDAKLRDFMRFELKQIQKEIGVTTIYVTHDQAEAIAISDEIIVMNKGRIEQAGAPHEIYAQPRTRFVAEFLGQSNFIEGIVVERDGDTVLVDCQGVGRIRASNSQPYEKGMGVTILIRPENFVTGSGLTGSNSVGGKIVRKSYLGSFYDYDLQIHNTGVLCRFQAKSSYAYGEEVNLSFGTRDCHLILRG